MYQVIELNVSKYCKLHFHNMKANNHYVHLKERYCTYTYGLAVYIIFVLKTVPRMKTP